MNGCLSPDRNVRAGPTVQINSVEPMGSIEVKCRATAGSHPFDVTRAASARAAVHLKSKMKVNDLCLWTTWAELELLLIQRARMLPEQDARELRWLPKPPLRWRCLSWIGQRHRIPTTQCSRFPTLLLN
jgi:hypothetical protein